MGGPKEPNRLALKWAMLHPFHCWAPGMVGIFVVFLFFVFSFWFWFLRKRLGSWTLTLDKGSFWEKSELRKLQEGQVGVWAPTPPKMLHFSPKSKQHPEFQLGECDLFFWLCY